MTGRSVYWHDGMFFWPQHMQTEERFLFQSMAHGQHWNVHHNWGIRSVSIILEELTTYRFVVDLLQMRLRDGTLIDVPENGQLSALDLQPAFSKSSAVTIFLALPKLKFGSKNVLDNSANEQAATPEDSEEAPALARYRVSQFECEDENAQDNAQDIRTRWLNLTLLTSEDPHDGFDVLPIARVMRGAEKDAVPQLDISYIPPVLTCDAWKPLMAEILQACYDRIGAKVESLAAEVVTRGISFDTYHKGAPKRFNQLHILNEASAVLHNVAFVEGVHPLTAYIELCRIVGKLSIFGPTREVPDLPRYDHDDLGGCFYRVMQYLEALLSEVAEAGYEERPFRGEQLRMQVELKPEWLQPIWSMFVGVRTSLDTTECVRMLTEARQLDMKIGSSIRVDDIFDRGREGLRFTHTTRLPQALPAEPGLIYFQIARESQQEEWNNVEKSLTLAIRMNQRNIVGDIQGQRALTIETGGKTTTMEFTLFLVAEEAS